MRAPRWMTLLALLLGLTLVAAACGGDEAATPDTEAGATADADAGADATDAADPAATDAAATDAAATDAAATDAAATDAAATDGGTETAAGAGAEELCTDEFSGVETPEGFRVGLVTDIGSVDDGTFNQYANDGMEAAAECFGFETDVIETASEADYQANLEAILAGEPDAVVTVGFLLGDATLQFAESNPDVAFIGVDQFQPEYPDNYVGIQFREDQGGYLAGTMAGLLTESGVLGVVAGRQDVPPVVRLANGFEAGAKAIDPEITVQIVYHESFSDPAAGQSTATQMLGEGADVIFGAGGPTGSGGVQAAADAGAWGIGVDQDEYFTTFGGGSRAGADRLATSAIKRVDLGVFLQIAAVLDGSFTGDTFTLTAENGGITYAPPHDADIPADVIEQLEEVRQGLADGSIETGLDPATGLPLEEATE